VRFWLFKVRSGIAPKASWAATILPIQPTRKNLRKIATGINPINQNAGAENKCKETHAFTTNSGNG